MLCALIALVSVLPSPKRRRAGLPSFPASPAAEDVPAVLASVVVRFGGRFLRIRTSALEQAKTESLEWRPRPAQSRMALLTEALTELSPQTQRVFRMHKFEGMSHPEVAAALGISRSAVEKHMMAALKHLLARLP